MLSLPLDLLNASFLFSIYVHRRFWYCITAHTTEFSIHNLVLFCFLHHYRQMGRPPCCDRSNVKKGLWTAEEDAKILAYVSSHGVGNWTLVPQKAGLNRCGKSCRLRWTNYLRPDLKHESFSPQEEELIINLHEAIGSRWSLIAKQLPGRTDNDVKNHWNTKLRKKLQKMGIDPVTHKPISQVITEFGNLKDNSKAGNQVASVSKRSSTDLIAWPEPSHVFTGQVQDDSFLIKPYPWDYFVQPAVINQETKEPRRCFNDVSSCCSSTSSSQSYSCQQPQAQITPSSPLMWSEFLLPDSALSTDFLQQEEKNHNGVPSEEGLVSDDCEAMNGNQATRHANAPSPASSFVDSILDKDEEMRSQFPQLLDPSFDY